MLNIYLLGLFLLGIHSCPVIDTDQRCKEMTYEYKNGADYQLPPVTRIRGIVKYETTGPIAVGACLGLFTVDEHTLVANTESDDNGHFDFQNIPDGDYRLVCKWNMLCPANAIIHLNRKSGGKESLKVIMRIALIDLCSYIDLDSKSKDK